MIIKKIKHKKTLKTPKQNKKKRKTKTPPRKKTAVTFVLRTTLAFIFPPHVVSKLKIFGQTDGSTHILVLMWLFFYSPCCSFSHVREKVAVRAY